MAKRSRPVAAVAARAGLSSSSSPVTRMARAGPTSGLSLRRPVPRRCEISTNGGHYIALDMPAAPYPLGGEARDVVEDVAPAGRIRHRGPSGFAEAGAPVARVDAPFDGIEIVNPDTGWRVGEQAEDRREVAARRHLAAALLDYPFRPAETIAGLIRSGDSFPRQWAALAARRRVVGVGGVDAHASSIWRRPRRQPVRAAVPELRVDVPRASIHVGRQRRCPGTPRPTARRHARDSRRTLVHGGRRRRDAALVRIQRDNDRGTARDGDGSTPGAR